MRLLICAIAYSLCAGFLGAAEYDALCQQLDAASFAERETASQKLKEWAMEHSETSADKLLGTYKVSESPEVKLRLLVLIKELVLQEKYGRPQGFVGVQMDAGSEKMDGDRIPVVMVTDVVKGTPADEFGIKKGDAIWKVDGKVFDRNTMSTLQFVRIVTEKKAGDKVEISLLRGGKKLNIKLVLGAMPEELRRINQLRMNLPKLENKDVYFDRWLEARLATKNVVKPKLAE